MAINPRLYEGAAEAARKAVAEEEAAKKKADAEASVEVDEEIITEETLGAERE